MSTTFLAMPGTRAGAEPAATRPLRVALVNMPWARIDAPSIQCGLLQSIARAAGHHCDVAYLNIEFAALFGSDSYDEIANVASERLHLIGEWLFSYAAFGEVTDEAQYLAEFPELAGLWERLRGGDLDDMIAVRREVLPGWLAEVAARPEWGTYDVVGFSSTFLQNTACLALGRMIKERHPDVRLVYGGANFDGEMGLQYAGLFPWLDYVVAGEADIAFPALLRQIADGEDVSVPGVHGYGLTSAEGDAERPTALDEFPPPHYDDYFTALDLHDRALVLGRRPVKLPVEFSRGCWWGQKHHCTFCGLNALGMGYRAKSHERAFQELSSLLADYPSVHVEAVDNIMDMKYVGSLCSELGKQHWDINIFFEVKANLSREQLGVLRQAGVLRIQPGIESLSTRVLGLMRKGATKLINIRLLKWAKYYGIDVAWNLLAGFPGESDSDYAEQLELLPLLHHLQPPTGANRIWLERFSPYFTDRSYPITDIRPQGSYRHIYPAGLDHGKIAYFFDYQASDTCGDEILQLLGKAVDTWKDVHEQDAPSLIYQRLPNRLTIIDSRTPQTRRAELTGWRAEAFEACGDSPRTAAAVAKHLAGFGHEVPADQVAAFLDQCCRAGVVVGDDGKYLSLAMPENPGW